MGKDMEPTPPAVLEAIGKELKAAIDELEDARQQDIAISAGLGVRTLGWYLAGRDIPVSKFLRIADAMGVPPGRLLTRLATAAANAGLKSHLEAIGADEQDITDTLRTITDSGDGVDHVSGAKVQQPVKTTRKRRGGGTTK